MKKIQNKFQINKSIKMDGNSDICSDLTLDITPEKFYVGAKSSQEDIVSIDRVTQEVKFGVLRKDIPQNGLHRHIYGLLGTINLIGGNYLVVLTGRRKVGSINGQSVWLVTNTEIIPYTKTQLHLTETQNVLNKNYISMVKQVLDTPSLYFSYSYDLTHTLQRLHHMAPGFQKLSLHERADNRFLWNFHLLRQYSSFRDLAKFCVPLMHGFVSIHNCTVNGHNFTWAIISRRSIHRVGARLFTRGADAEGNVANFVETEQIVEYNVTKCSFVQTRGSIPVFWQQLPTLKYKPKVKLIASGNHGDALQRHLETQVYNYGKQVLVNLIDHRGAELTLEQAFRDYTAKLGMQQVRYEAFDFHHECRKMSYHKLSVLMDRLALEQDDFGYFMISYDDTILALQQGAFRTNCIDCLDRTNVVQSLLARRNLTVMLQRLGILRQNETVEGQGELETLFKNVWADHADAISIQYSGTPALKTDFTRTGKRTRAGLWRDAINSLTRYYKNNFTDGFRQDAMDLFVGNYVVSPEEGVTVPCPLDQKKGWKYVTFPMVLLVAMSMFCANVISPSTYKTETLLYLLFWGSMVSGTLATIFNYGVEFVDYPKLTEKRIFEESN